MSEQWQVSHDVSLATLYMRACRECQVITKMSFPLYVTRQAPEIKFHIVYTVIVVYYHNQAHLYWLSFWLLFDFRSSVWANILRTNKALTR